MLLAAKRLLKKQPRKLLLVPKALLTLPWKALKTLPTLLLVPLKALPTLLVMQLTLLLVQPVLQVQLLMLLAMLLVLRLTLLLVQPATLLLVQSTLLRMLPRRLCNSTERFEFEKGGCILQGMRPFFCPVGAGMFEMMVVRSIAIAIFIALPLSACGSDPAATGGVSPGEAKALNDAAEMLDEENQPKPGDAPAES